MTSHDALSHPPVHIVGQLVDARLSLLDRQVVDVDGRPVGVLDDLELTDVASPLEPGTPPPEVTSLVHGPIVLERIFGGRRPDAHLLRIGWDAVANWVRRLSSLPRRRNCRRPGWRAGCGTG